MIRKSTIKYDKKIYTILESDTARFCKGLDYNFNFSKKDGMFVRWGRKHSHDPDFSPIGPEIMDIEITNACKGINGVPCKFCYKSNTPDGKYMPFEKFKILFDYLPQTVCQIAFGVDSQCKTNPDCWKIFEYTRNHGVIPNITVAQIDKNTAYKLARTMGAISVSRYDDKNICYNSIKMLGQEAFQASLGKKETQPITLRQINIHVLLSEETFPMVMETLEDVKKDETLNFFLSSVVILSLKQKGRGENLTPIGDNKFKELIKFITNDNIRVGFDSCTCNKFLSVVKDHAHYGQYKMVSEPCEAACFSLYSDVDGRIFPCSFSEGIEWLKGYNKLPFTMYMIMADAMVEGIDIFRCKNFQKDIWHHPLIKEWRKRLIDRKRSCPIYNI